MVRIATAPSPMHCAILDGHIDLYIYIVRQFPYRYIYFCWMSRSDTKTGFAKIIASFEVDKIIESFENAVVERGLFSTESLLPPHSPRVQND